MLKLIFAVFMVAAVFLMGMVLAVYLGLKSGVAAALSLILSYLVLRKIAGPAKFGVRWGIFDKRKPNVDHILGELKDPADKIVAERVASFLSAFYGVDVAHVRLDDDLWVRGFRPYGMLPQVKSVHAKILGRRLGVRLRAKEYDSMRTMRQFIEFVRNSNK
ncbi:hypothetical protein G7939_23055 (plasmid) [Ralstonia solanacearum]|uniref:hypothetical protein n=1 Tax=Ralstonia pseudosolanacearum TaxID=1310165 RepID=UPI00125FD3A4|nr:hypothetical protein [Ralstonia pseudosolanacearum]QIK26242.1 hypothetical protein G7939_23055 [Ralstonia solanacearum]